MKVVQWYQLNRLVQSQSFSLIHPLIVKELTENDLLELPDKVGIYGTHLAVSQ